MHPQQQMIKDQMDRKFGSPWHVIVGRAFAYEITYEVRLLGVLSVGAC
jgi:dynein light chain 4